MARKLHIWRHEECGRGEKTGQVNAKTGAPTGDRKGERETETAGVLRPDLRRPFQEDFQEEGEPHPFPECDSASGGGERNRFRQAARPWYPAAETREKIKKQNPSQYLLRHPCKYRRWSIH